MVKNSKPERPEFYPETNPIYLEWFTWQEIWKVIRELTGLSQEEINKPEWRKLAIVIEKWAYFDRRRREFNIAEGKDYGEDGVFWQLEKKE